MLGMATPIEILMNDLLSNPIILIIIAAVVGYFVIRKATRDGARDRAGPGDGQRP